MMRKTFVLFWLSLILVLPSLGGQEGQARKIAIASDGKTVASAVSDRAARCMYFLMFDDEGHLTEVLDNPHRKEMEMGGAGPKTADFLAQEEVTSLVAGNVGQKNDQGSANEENRLRRVFRDGGERS
jgi:hypothetical protein